MDKITTEAHRKDRMVDFFVRAESGMMTHEHMAEHLLEALEVRPYRSYEIILAKMYEQAPTPEAMDQYARTWAKAVGASMGLKGYVQPQAGTDDEGAQPC